MRSPPSITRRRARPRASPRCFRRNRRWPRTISLNSAGLTEALTTWKTSAPGIEQHLPARLPEAVAPVDLLAEHEEALVEDADGVDGLAPDEQAGAAQVLRLAHGLVVEAAAVERVQRLRARSELAQEEVLGRDPPGRRVAADRPLQRPVRVEEPRPRRSPPRDARPRRRRASRARRRSSQASGVQEQEVVADAARMPALFPAPKPRFSSSIIRASGNFSRTSSVFRRSSRCRRRASPRPSRAGSRGSARSSRAAL